MVVFFFFSSRRRHTRCSRDWSSDVCSSDLSGGCEIQSKIICRAGPPIKPRIQRQLFKIAVENQVVLLLAVGTFDHPQSLKVLPDMRALLDSAETDQAFKVGLNRRQGKRTMVCCDEAPNTVGSIVVTPGAQEINVAHLAR